MEIKKIVDSILENVRGEITQFVEKEPTIICPIEYELTVLEITKTFARQLISESQGKIPKSGNLTQILIQCLG